MFLLAASRFSMHMGMSAPNGIWNGEGGLDVVVSAAARMQVEALAKPTLSWDCLAPAAYKT